MELVAGVRYSRSDGDVSRDKILFFVLFVDASVYRTLFGEK
jgi:hypothetical protein